MPKVLLVGATGVIGSRLVPLLTAAGHEVTGTTRSSQKLEMLRRLGASAVVVDVFDATALTGVVNAAKPDVIINQLTDLPDTLPDVMAEVLARNSRVRIKGTRNLMDAAEAAGVRRVIAQSLAFVYAPGPLPHREDDPLDARAEAAVTVGGVVGLERAVMGSPGIVGIVLRYGRLYGPLTWSASPPEAPALHVDAAAQSTSLAVTRGAPGVYNIADDDGAVSIAKARADLGFDPAFRVP
jgi:nucleoside-diphosphate-sugar epimerase